MNEEHDKPENEHVLDREEIHEENKRLEHEAHQHENQNPNRGKPINPKHAGIGGK